jgi:hypothetical protein
VKDGVPSLRQLKKKKSGFWCQSNPCDEKGTRFNFLKDESSVFWTTEEISQKGGKGETISTGD